MMRDGIDFLDVDYGVMPLEKKPRQIRTKSTSFSQIKKYFNDFRIRLLTKKLEREKDKAVTEAYPEVFSKKDDERMMKRATTIARLEQKIKILDGETVPIDYIDKRAIKIKKAMMKNISYTSGNIYSVGLENKEEVFNVTKEPEAEAMDSEVRESIAADVRKIMEEEKKEAEVQDEVASYTPSAVTKAEIRAEIDEEFDKVAARVKANEVHEEKAEEPHINLDEIKASIDEAFKEVQKSKEVPQATIGTDVVKEVVDESYESVNVDGKISLEDIKNEVDEAMDRVVSKNGATSAKIDRFNEDGSRRESYTYTPMTDEEIKAAQANIEYDKYEQIYREQHEVKFKTAEFKDIFKPADPEGFNVEEQVVEEAVREVPVIVPEVDERFIPERKVVVEEDTPSVVSKPTSIEEFGRLKAKVEILKKKLAESESKKDAALQFAARTSDRAEDIKRKTIDSEKVYQDRLASLQLLAKTLEENCNLNDTAARAAAIDAECNERFINSQIAKKEQFDDAINQVDSILGYSFEEEPVVSRGRAA